LLIFFVGTAFAQWYADEGTTAPTVRRYEARAGARGQRGLDRTRILFERRKTMNDYQRNYFWIGVGFTLSTVLSMALAVLGR
jgi:hypothetical protein